MASTNPNHPEHGAYQHYTQNHDPANLNGAHHANGANGSDFRDGYLPPSKHQSTVSQVYNPGFFKFANPGPLGLISFAITTFVLGMYQCGVGLPGSNAFGDVGPDQVVFGLALFMGGLAQLIAGIMEFRVGNTFGTTVHISYGAFWLSFAMFSIPGLGIAAAYGGNARALSVHLGIYLIAWCFLTLIFLIAALRTNVAILAVFFFLTLAFFLLAIAQFIQVTHPTNAVRVNRAGGAIAIIDAFCAFYAGAAGLMTPATTMVRFPLGEFSRSQPAANKSAA
ncbi:Ammonia transport outward protein 2 [Paramyrothecium foliicola]|nr:Ammonia transport outward protein 2 [Paramyrothecium foliicola]